MLRRPPSITRTDTICPDSTHCRSVVGCIGLALSHRMYRLDESGNAISTVGRWIFRTALAWLTWVLTESAAWLVVIAFADTIPMVVLSIFAGAVSDRIGPLRLMKAVQLGIRSEEHTLNSSH